MTNLKHSLATVAEPQPAPANKKKTSTRQRPPSAGTRNGDRPAPKPPDDAFADIGAKPAEAHTWHHHSVLWFQPERPPAPPAWTGLGIERRNRIPRPDLLPLETAPLDRPALLETPLGKVNSSRRLALPASDLMPLGWDARAICRKEEV